MDWQIIAPVAFVVGFLVVWLIVLPRMGLG
jgi:hypothetical protein